MEAAQRNNAIGGGGLADMVQTAIRANTGRGSGGFCQGAKVSNPAEMLSMLAQHGIMIGHIPGGKPDLVALDIAGALGMAHDQPGAAMLLAKYTMDGYAAHAFGDHWNLLVDRRAYVERWGNDNRTRSLAEYSYAEWLDSQKCRTCKGVGSQMTPEGKVGQCGSCDGTGLRKIGDRPVARALGMSNEGYRKSPWSSRIGWCRSELVRRELSALVEFSRHLTGRQ